MENDVKNTTETNNEATVKVSNDRSGASQTIEEPSTQTVENAGVANEDAAFHPNIEIPSDFIQYDKDKSEDLSEMTIPSRLAEQTLGLSKQTLINYTKTFYDILAVWQNPINRYYNYSELGLKQIAFIVNDRRNSGRTMAQEKEFMMSKLGKKVGNLAIDNTNTLESMFNQMAESIIAAQTDNMKRILDLQNGLLLEQKDAQKAEKESLAKQLSEVSALLSRQESENTEKLSAEITRSREREIELEKEIATLKEQLRLKDEELAHKKKGFLGLFH